MVSPTEEAAPTSSATRDNVTPSVDAAGTAALLTKDTPDVVVKTSYMARKERTFVQDTVRLLYQKVNADAKTPAIKKRTEFVTYLKNVLDRRFGSHHHVICGEQVGYAAKCKPATLCKLQVDTTLSVIIYKSPRAEAALDKSKHEEEWQVPENYGSRKVEVIHCPPVDSNSYTSITQDVRQMVKKYASHFQKDDDPLVLARRVREGLTRSFGTLWHVFVGSDFAAECGQNRRNDILVKVGNTKMLCFQHEQTNPRRMDWSKVAAAVPYVVTVLFFLGYLANLVVCNDSRTTAQTNDLLPSSAEFTNDLLCRALPENMVGVICAVIVLIVTMRRIGAKNT